MIAVIARILDGLKTIAALLVRRHVDEKKLRVELYDRRITVFNAIRDYMWAVLASGRVQTEDEQKFLQSTQQVSFLFGKSIKRFVDEIFEKSGRLRALPAMEGKLSGKALEQNLDKQNAIKEWFMREAKGLEHRFGKYLNL
jgi:hypothetical protein